MPVKSNWANGEVFNASDANAVAADVNSAVKTGGALGTPSSGSLTNCTSLPVSGITSSTTATLGLGALEVGHATDTTLTRSAAGRVAVEGVDLVDVSSTQTLSGKTFSGTLAANAFAPGVTSTATAGGTTTMTAASTQTQVWTGAGGNQSVVLPSTGVAAGAQYNFINNSSSDNVFLTVGGSTIATVRSNSAFSVTALQANPTSTAHWQIEQRLNGATLRRPTLSQPIVDVLCSDSSFTTVLQLLNETSSVNYVQIGARATGGTPRVVATGTDTNVSLNLQTKGSGTVQANGVDVVTTTGGQNVTLGTVTPATLNASSVGYTGMPANSQSTAYTLVAADAGKHIIHPSSDNNARTFTIPANSSVAYPVGTVITFVNAINTLTIAITTDTLTLAGSSTTGSRTLAANGVATAIKIGSTNWLISGAGLT